MVGVEFTDTNNVNGRWYRFIFQDHLTGLEWLWIGGGRPYLGLSWDDNFGANGLYSPEYSFNGRQGWQPSTVLEQQTLFYRDDYASFCDWFPLNRNIALGGQVTITATGDRADGTRYEGLIPINGGLTSYRYADQVFHPILVRRMNWQTSPIPTNPLTFTTGIRILKDNVVVRDIGLNLSNNWKASFWIRLPRAGGGTGTIFSGTRINAANGLDNTLYLNGNATWRYYKNGSQTSTQTSFLGLGYAAHVYVSVVNDIPQIYVNGQPLQENGQVAWDIDGIFFWGNDGGRIGSNNFNIDALFTEIALKDGDSGSQAEAIALCNEMYGQDALDVYPNWDRYYKCDEGSGTVLNDTMGNQNANITNTTEPNYFEPFSVIE